MSLSSKPMICRSGDIMIVPYNTSQNIIFLFIGDFYRQPTLFDEVEREQVDVKNRKYWHSPLDSKEWFASCFIKNRHFPEKMV